MKCGKCKSVNVHNANYCKKCAYHFTKADQETAEKKTFVGFLKKVEKIKSYIDLSFITDELWFRIVSIVIVLGVGIYSFVTCGINLMIEESDEYTAQYNDELNEHYLYATDSKTELNLYVPDRAKKLIVKHYDSKDKMINEKDYKTTDSITLDSSSDGDYYIVEAEYNKSNYDRVKLFIFQVKESE